MTDQRKQLEQVAREFVAQLERDSSLLDDLKEARWRSVCLPDLLEGLVDLLAAQRKAVLKEVGKKVDILVGVQPHQHCASCNQFVAGLLILSDWVKERRP